MYPTVRPGDVWRIHACSADEIAVGDIAVCRGPDFLFGHRVIGKGVRDGRPFIVTRPDRAHEGSDAPTFDENLLGVVVAVTRHGKPVPLVPTAHRWPLRRLLAVRLRWLEARPRARRWLVDALARAQSRRLYGVIARRWLEFTRPHISCTVRLPLNETLGDGVYREIDAGEFDADAAWHRGTVERWTLALHLSAAREPAAWAAFRRLAGHAWRLEQSCVRVRYRGAGLEDELRRQARALLARGKIPLEGNQE